MSKKIMSLGLVAAMVIGMPVSIQANDIDQQINSKQAQLQNQEQAVAENEQALKRYTDEQERVTQRVAEVERVMAQTQQEMDALIKEMSMLEIMINKRENSIKEQARNVQVLDQGSYIMEAIFSSESIVDIVTQIVTAAELSGHATDMLSKQQQDKAALEEKQVLIENKTTQFLAQKQELVQLQDTLSVAVQEAEVARATLALEKAQTQEEITRLTEQKAEAERQKAIALEAEKEKQAQQREAQARAVVSPSTGTPTATPAVATPTLATGFIYPLANPTVTSGFGVARQLTLLNGSSYSDVHNGIDYVNGNSSAPIVAVADGTVVWAGTDSSGGVGVIIKHANGLYTHYWHLSSLMVASGTTVSQGQQLGIIGKTGLATGIHLHFGVSTQMYSGYVNPALYVG